MMQDLAEFLASLPVERFDTGEEVLRQGGTDRLVYILKSGSVSVLKDGVEVAEVSEPGAIFGEMYILLGQPNSAAVVALEPSEFHRVEDAQAALAKHPEAALHVARILASRLDSLNRYLVDVKSQFKEYSDHLGMVDEVLGALMNKHPRKIERRPFKEL